MTRLRRTLALGLGILLAMAPVGALAADSSSRVLSPPPDAAAVFMYTIGALVLAMLLASIGWLYQQKRGLHWDFQAADASHATDAHH